MNAANENGGNIMSQRQAKRDLKQKQTRPN